VKGLGPRFGISGRRGGNRFEGTFSGWRGDLDRRRGRGQGSGPIWSVQYRVTFPAPPPRNGGVRLGRTGGGTGVHVVGQGTAEYSTSTDNGGAARSGRGDSGLLGVIVVNLAASEPPVKRGSHWFIIDTEL